MNQIFITIVLNMTFVMYKYISLWLYIYDLIVWCEEQKQSLEDFFVEWITFYQERRAF